jgi:hypothetical protein
MSEFLKTLELLNKRLDNYEGELKKVKESKQSDNQTKQQSSGNYSTDSPYLLSFLTNVSF